MSANNGLQQWQRDILRAVSDGHTVQRLHEVTMSCVRDQWRDMQGVPALDGNESTYRIKPLHWKLALEQALIDGKTIQVRLAESGAYHWVNVCKHDRTFLKSNTPDFWRISPDSLDLSEI